MSRLLAIASMFVALSGCGHASAPANAPLARGADEARSPEAVLVHFVARHESERWSLRQSDGSFVCALPCAYWVQPNSGLSVRLDSKASALSLEDEVTYAVPERPAAAAGDTMVIEVDRTHAGGTVGKIVAIPLTITFGIFGAAMTTMGIGGIADGGHTSKSTVGVGVETRDPNGNVVAGAHTESSQAGTGAAVTTLVLGIGFLGVSALSGYWWTRAREGGLEEKRAATPSSSRTGGLHVEPTPFGVRGTF